MKIFSKVLVISVLSVFIVSCSADRSREEKVSAMINKVDSPFLIASTNLQTLMDKSEVMKEGTLPFTYYQVISFFLAAELTGIDYDTDAQFVVGKGDSFQPDFFGIFKIEKEDLFVELLEVEANAEIKEKDGMKYALKDKEHYCVVWKEDIAVIASVPVDLMAMLSGKGGGGMKTVDKCIGLINAAEDGDVNEEYIEFLKNDADLAMRFNGKAFYGYMESMMEIGMDEGTEEMQKMKDLYEGMAYDLFLNFNDGSVELEMIANLDEKLKEQLSFVGNTGVNDELFTYGKSPMPLLTGSYHVELKGLMDYMKEISLDDYHEMVDKMKDQGLDLEQLTDAFSGELVYMIDGVVKKEEVYDFGYEEPITIKRDEPIFALVLGVSDKSIIEKKLTEVMTGENTQNEQAEPKQDLPEISVMANGVMQVGDAFLFLKRDALFMSNDSSWANTVAAGRGVTVSNPNNVLNEKAMGMYADFSKLGNLAGMGDEAEVLQMFKAIYGSANLEGGKFTIEMTDASQNSLKLITMAVGAALADMERQQNPDLEAELEEALQETEDAFEKLEEDIDADKIQNAVEEAIKEIK